MEFAKRLLGRFGGLGFRVRVRDRVRVRLGLGLGIFSLVSQRPFVSRPPVADPGGGGGGGVESSSLRVAKTAFHWLIILV